MKISIVTTLFKSALYIEPFCQRASSVANQLFGDDYEIILVNDGSPDSSLEIAIKQSENNRNIVVVDLSRNFGHHKAMMEGLNHSKGDIVFLIDSDLEEEPEWLLNFFDVMKSEIVDVVYGVQQSRKGGWFERISGKLWYSIFNWLTDIDHPHNIVTARLMSRRYVNALLQFSERELIISCLWVITGFKQLGVPIKKHMTSPSTYSLLKKMENATNSIISFSTIPLKLIFYTGIMIFAGALIYSMFLIYGRLILNYAFEGWTSVMVSIWLLGGMVISFVGIIGIYLAKVFSETKQRPNTIVRAIYRQIKNN